MATLTIHDLPDEVRDRIQKRAAARGRSMDSEIRDLLSGALAQEADPAAVERQRQKIEHARRLVREVIPEGTPIVEEFLRERRGNWGNDG